MSGIVGSKLNIRGSGRIAKLGTDGQVLTSSGLGVAANYEAAGGGDTVLIKGAAMTASAYLDLTDVFSSTYDNYVIRWNGLVKDTTPSGVGGLPYIGFLDSSDAHMASGTYYTKAINLYGNWTTATVSGGVYNHANGFYVANGWYWNADDKVQTGEMSIWNPLHTGTYYPTPFFQSTFIQDTGTNHPGCTHGIGYFNNNGDAKHGIRFGISEGSFIANGNVAVYGIKYT